MNLNNLKKQVPTKLYKRGLDYFEQGFVKGLTEDAPNRFHARVAGTRDYQVSVNLTKDGTIVGSYCTCPFESDSLCKHEVAVCLAIREYKEENRSPAEDVLTQLKMLKKAELLEILEELVEKQPSVSLYLKEKLADPNSMNEDKARRIIRKSVSRASSRGFIERKRVNQALEGVEEVLEYIEGLNLERDAERIIRLRLLVIAECTRILLIADSSSGSIGSVVYDSLKKIEETLAEWTEELDEATVDNMLALLYPHILFAIEQDITDASTYLAEAVLQWNERGDFTDKFYGFIEGVIGSKQMQNKPYDYEEKRFRLLQLKILQQTGDQEAVEEFYVKYHSYSEIRKAQIQQALDAGEYEKVLGLCEESEDMDANLPGLVHDWKKFRFEAYEGMGRTAEMIELGFQFAQGGEEEYYVKLKNVVDPEQWPEKLDTLLAEMKNRQWGLPLYLKILIEEERFEELLDYSRAEVSAIEQLHPHLMEDYPHEVNEIYTNYIYQQIERASNRKAYWTACQKIKDFKQAFGAEPAAVLIEELKFMYPKRTAFLDELEKIR